MQTLSIFTFLILLFLGGFWSGNLVRKNYFAKIADHEGRTNFLLLGMNGGSAPGDDLTDTMIFLSLNQKTGKAAMISIPRDIWLDSLKIKINAAYHYGGADLVRQTVEEVLGQKIDYLAVVSFDGFKQVIDALGGVRINVARAFDDYQYPIKGRENDLCNGDKELKCRYEHVHFDAGWQTMNGETALKFVRSRKAEGEEGTDFARSQRQELLLKSLKQTILDEKLYLHPQKLLAALKAAEAAIKTDLTPDQYGTLLELAAKMNWEEVKTYSLAENLLTNPKSHYSKQWVLLPKAGNWAEVHRFVAEFLK